MYPFLTNITWFIHILATHLTHFRINHLSCHRAQTHLIFPTLLLISSHTWPSHWFIICDFWWFYLEFSQFLCCGCIDICLIVSNLVSLESKERHGSKENTHTAHYIFFYHPPSRHLSSPFSSFFFPHILLISFTHTFSHLLTSFLAHSFFSPPFILLTAPLKRKIFVGYMDSLWL